MELKIRSRLKNAWNAFTNRDPTYDFRSPGMSYSYRPDRVRLTRGNERSIVNAVFTRIAIDSSQINIIHCRLDEDGKFKEHIKSPLNSCLTLEANIDQTGRAFIIDAVMSMLDEGVVALVPVDTDVDPTNRESFNILTIRTAKILEWRPTEVKLKLYNENKGIKEEIWLPKRAVAIIENPLYSIINEPNSTMQRLMRKLSLLDVTDEQTASGKLDLILQLPYTLKSDAKKLHAKERVKEIEDQLAGNKYGIAYTDGTEKITQLNRSLENKLMSQVEYLTNLLFSQLGITQSILDGTADDQTLLNYYNRTIEPIISAITDEMNRKFLTKTARTQGQAIKSFRDPFKLVPINNIAEIADKFTRNCIMTSNEIRQVIGMKPSDDAKADELINNNISQPADEMMDGMSEEIPEESYNKEQNLDQEELKMDSLVKNLTKYY